MRVWVRTYVLARLYMGTFTWFTQNVRNFTKYHFFKVRVLEPLIKGPYEGASYSGCGETLNYSLEYFLGNPDHKTSK